jgi:hypothetical protein
MQEGLLFIAIMALHPVYLYPSGYYRDDFVGCRDRFNVSRSDTSFLPQRGFVGRDFDIYHHRLGRRGRFFPFVQEMSCVSHFITSSVGRPSGSPCRASIKRIDSYLYIRHLWG